MSERRAGDRRKNDPSTPWTGIDRRQFIRRVGAMSALALMGVEAACTVPSVTGPEGSPVAPPGPLHAGAQAKGFYFGASFKERWLVSEPDYAASLASECGILVPESALTWETVRPSAGTFNFANADTAVGFATGHSLPVRGHTLVWHSKMPAWLTQSLTPTTGEAILREHVRTTVGRYAGRITSWDVVNEIVATGDQRPDALRITPWLNALGPAFIDIAFDEASRNDPACELMYNDFGMEYSDVPGERKRAAVLRLLSDLKSRGVPIHGLCLQSHLNPAQQAFFDEQKLRSFLADVAALGMRILVSELDVTDQALPADITQRDTEVADAYRSYLDVVLDERSLRGVLTWGITDRHSWLSDFRPRSDGLPVRSLPLDATMQEKTAYKAMTSAFSVAPSR